MAAPGNGCRAVRLGVRVRVMLTLLFLEGAPTSSCVLKLQDPYLHGGSKRLFGLSWSTAWAVTSQSLNGERSSSCSSHDFTPIPCSSFHLDAAAANKGLSQSPARLRLALLEITPTGAVAHAPSPATAQCQPSLRSPVQQPAVQPKSPGRGVLGPFPCPRVSV